MKVSLSVDQLNITPREAQVVDMLCESLKQDVELLKCPNCGEEGQIILHVNNTKISALRTEIKVCCPEYYAKTEEALALNV
ncbi:hypothetical protein [Fulvivirga lutea]|uniref:Uncharacterized protein n=1 Tax=Fulvivirga lutea TaxID=2810512 RepID=A0A974WHS1_9BACT|nr:hypothetical protein [Fulvivirga lutea]QSE97462.1 hypothetical protein JR347_18080 [Fulvivirga lutea]